MDRQPGSNTRFCLFRLQAEVMRWSPRARPVWRCPLAATPRTRRRPHPRHPPGRHVTTCRAKAPPLAVVLAPTVAAAASLLAPGTATCRSSRVLSRR